MGNKKLYIVVIIAIAVVLMFWWWSSRQAGVETPLNTSDINQDLNELNVGDVDQEFKTIDQELNTL